MDVCRLLMYTMMGCILAASIASSNIGYSHSMPDTRFAVIPVIRRAARWRNSVKTLIIYPVNTQLLLPYSSTNCSTTL